jgi:tRNA(Ile)-lysidine synthase
MGRPGQRLVTDADGALVAVARALDVIEQGAAVVVAVSGGPDSTGLAALVHKARPDIEAVAAHVRHGLRDDAPDAAAALALAQHLDIKHVEVSVVVEAADGVEADARRARYDALARCAAQVGARWVLVGHTADDQAETVLLNIARGAGTAGASGMPPRRPLGTATLLRPLLEVRRSAVRAVAAALAADGVVPVADPMNDDTARRRTRVRTEVLPAIGSLTGGGTDPVEALSRFAALAAADDAALRAIADEVLSVEVRSWGTVVALRWDVVAALAPAIAARVVRRLCTPQVGGPGSSAGGLTAEATQRVLALQPGRSVPLPDGRVAARGSGWLTIAPLRSAPSFEVPLGAGMLGVAAAGNGAPDVGVGEDIAPLPHLDVAVVRGPVPDPGVLPFWAPAGAAAVVPAVDTPLTVRPARRDDQILSPTPRRLAQAIRAAVPGPARPDVIVIADEHGPVWVPGVAVRAGLEDRGAGYLTLRLC